MTEPTDDLRTTIAKPIYDILEGPVNTQDFGRQTRQWEMSLLLADAAIAAYRQHPDGAAADRDAGWQAAATAFEIDAPPPWGTP